MIYIQFTRSINPLFVPRYKRVTLHDTLILAPTSSTTPPVLVICTSSRYGCGSDKIGHGKRAHRSRSFLVISTTNSELNMAKLEQLSCAKHFGGTLTKYKFKSGVLGNLDAKFNVFLPSSSAHGKVPVLMYLGGLTCTEDNAAQKGGFMRDAAAEGIAIIFPDTSPRGAGIQGEDDHWDFGTGAGWYVDATHPQWIKHYKMFTHVAQELPEVIEAAGLPVDFSRQSVLGHSMGGHGALVLYLTSLLCGSNTYRSCSAFAPFCAPSVAPWGIKAFNGYLSGGVEEGRDKYDATLLIERVRTPVNILIDYGTADEFKHQLNPDLFIDAARKAGFDETQVQVRGQDGYDHSYYFVATFAPEHVKFHARILKA